VRNRAVVVAAAVFLLLVATGLGVFLLRLRSDTAPRADVAVTSTLSPTATGVRVHAEVTASSGSLPPTLQVPAEVTQQDLSSRTADVRIGARSPVRSVRVDGAPVEAGSSVDVNGNRVVLDYEVGAQDTGGHRVVDAILDVPQWRPRTVEVTVQGEPVWCEVPAGFQRGDPTQLWTQPCPAGVVRVERGVPDEPGLSRVAVPAWVGVDYGP
jgi:hypothetical protein